MPYKANLKIDQGSHFSYDVLVKDQQGNPFNFVNFTANGQMRKHFESANSTNLVISLSEGVINITVSANTSLALDPGRYMYDVVLHQISGNSEPNRVLEGIVTITPSITR
jgi:hypothetical protein